MDFLTYLFEKNDCCLCTTLLYLCLLIGFFKVAFGAISFMHLIYRHFIRPAKDFYRIYGGNDSWAVVTGGSDGIGEEFCHVLAKQGFNICIVARNETKMK